MTIFELFAYNTRHFDRRQVLYLCHNLNEVSVVKNERGEVKVKPLPIAEYNTYMTVWFTHFCSNG